MTDKTLLRSGATYLANNPFAVATIDGFSVAASVGVERVIQEYGDISTLGRAVLDHERQSMRVVQARVSKLDGGGFVRLRAGFAEIGALLANDVIVRAAIRIASESHDSFPERRLDPFLTWSEFVYSRLSEAQREGTTREGVDLREACRLLVAAGIGTKDFIALHGLWGEAEALLDRTAAGFIRLLAVDDWEFAEDDLD